MNLLNIHTKRWEDNLLDICSCGTGKELKEKLGEPEVNGLNILGDVHEYFVKRYGFNKGIFKYYELILFLRWLSNLSNVYLFIRL